MQVDLTTCPPVRRLQKCRDPQQLDLEGRRRLPDLVEEEGSSLRLLEDPLRVERNSVGRMDQGHHAA